MRHRMVRGGTLVTLVALLAWLPAAPAAAQQGAADGEWRHYAGDSGSTKYAPLDQINADNVGRLRIAWTRPGVDQSILDRVPNLNVSSSLTNTPLMVDGILYGSNSVGLAEAFDPATGETLWVQEPMDPAPQGYRGAETRGVGYWTDGSDARILVQRGQHLIALNAKTGRPYSDFGDGGRVNLTIGLGPEARYRWTGAPLVVGDVVVMGQSMTDTFITMEAVRAPVRAFDVRTGEQRWEFHTIPRAGEYGTDTWEDDSWQYSGHAPVWSLMSADPELGYVYLPVTSPTSDMYGGHRVGDNLYGQSIVCVDAETGERVWHFQTVHHGLWDYDLPTGPILMDLEVEGRPGITKAVVQLTKQAMAFAFDRATGEPLWPIEERPVPQSDTPGERASPTQPFPTRPPPYDRHGSNVENLIDFTPELRREALEIVSRYTIGPIFTPPSIRGGSNLGTIQLPGSQGGSDVQGGAYDPETGYLYVPSITAPFVADVLEGNPDRTNLSYVKGTRLWIGGPRGLPLFKPPYGRITAIDMKRGEFVWMVPNGHGPRNHPARDIHKLGPGLHRFDPSLYLRVSPRGARSWVQRLVVRGRQVDRGLGGVDLVSLDEARLIALENRRKARILGVDPFAERQRRQSAPTFADAERETLAANRGRWAPNTVKVWGGVMRRHVLPRLGKLRIADVTRDDLIGCLSSIKAVSAARAARVRIGQVFELALSRGWCSENPARGGNGLDAAVPHLRGRSKGHHAAAPHADVSGILRRVDATTAGPAAKACLRFAVLTAVRSSEARGAEWSEIDLPARTWTIPAGRMKSNREHRVPLSDQAVAVLERRRGQHDRFVFASERTGAPVSDETLARLVRPEGVTVHGFRSSFADWGGETGHDGDLVQHAIAHVVGNQVTRAYARSDLFDRRRALMAAWGDYCTK